MFVRMQESFIDYPDPTLFGVVLFTEGCNFDCKYCSNFELKQVGKLNVLDYEYIFKYLNPGIIECMTITGGEPSIHRNKLISFLSIIREKYPNILIKVDTNGSLPEVIQQLLNDKLVNCVAIDIKSDLDKYNKVVGVNFDISLLIKTIILCLNNIHIDTVLRTTMVDTFITAHGFELLLDEFIDHWDSNRHAYHLQQFVPSIAEKNIFNKMNTSMVSNIQEILNDYGIDYINIE